MRSDIERRALEMIASNSKGSTLRYKNERGEVFEYENGKLVAYTDTRVIDHDTDRLVNLAETPFET